MKIVFNSSLPRSGSTLLQNILAQNPDFYCTPTSSIFDCLFSARQTFSKVPEVMAQEEELMRKGFLSFCAGGLQGFCAGITDRPVCVDKSRGWIGEFEWLSNFHPDPKILVCIRDPRAVLSSMEKRWRKSSHLHPAEHALDTSGIKMATVENRVGYWLNSNPVGSSITKVLGSRQRGFGFHVVKFEELTTQPQAILDGIYDYLGEPRFTHDFTHVAQMTHEKDAFFGMYGNHVIRQEVKPVPLDYHEILGKALCATIRQDNGPFYTAFYPGR